MENIIKEIKHKPELKDLPNSLVEKTLNEYLSKNGISLSNSIKERKIIIKEIRAQLRKYSGQYTSKSNIKNREELIKEGRFSEILNQHASTRERSADYEEIKEIINNLNPKSILDLGCGLNPLAIASQEVNYYAYDIKEEDLNIVSEFFKINGIKGEVHNKDIRITDNFPKADLCIIFKVLDILGDNRNETARKLLTTINSNFFLISFATRTLGGKPMNSPYRRWFEKILNELKYPYEVKRMKQEVVYLIKKA
ncbi:hypothetical protein J4423_04420 [Candidatus Pacearchaeota archaeon]|nr:hypothetical protein [Candidatus Pacearchaeota archaeon]